MKLSILMAALALASAQAVASGPPTTWQHSDVKEAHAAGYKGQGTRITVVDDFSGRFGRLSGTLTDYGPRSNRAHGRWVLDITRATAPGAAFMGHDLGNSRAVLLDSTRMNVLNLSYGMFASQGWTSVGWSSREASIINAARQGTAVVVKAAGNDAVAIGAANRAGDVDYLARDLANSGSQSAILVGVLNTNGSTEAPATMAWYSNIAGNEKAVQDRFLVVGVEGHKTGLHGTSFAAPVVSGYAAVVKSKFTAATPTQVANQLLNTARTDTVAAYNPAIHGKGEASLSRALAPVTIN